MTSSFDIDKLDLWPWGRAKGLALILLHITITTSHVIPMSSPQSIRLCETVTSATGHIGIVDPGWAHTLNKHFILWCCKILPEYCIYQPIWNDIWILCVAKYRKFYNTILSNDLSCQTDRSYPSKWQQAGSRDWYGHMSIWMVQCWVV